MTMKIGIDFGAACTKIIYSEKGQPRLFLYPEDTHGNGAIPSAIAYSVIGKSPSRCAGINALDRIYEPGLVSYYQDFKECLSLPEGTLRPTIGKDNHDIESVVHDYFEEILSGLTSSSKENGRIDEILLAVPDPWYKNKANTELNHLLKVFITLGFQEDKIHFQSESVCAAASYVFPRQQIDGRKKDYNVLVCDMGGSAFRVTHCEVREGRSIQARYQGTSCMAGRAFDLACIQAICLANQGGLPKNPIDLYGMLHAFENTKVNPKLIGNTDEQDTPGLITREDAQDEYIKDNDAYHFDGKGITVTQVWEAFEPIQKEIRAVLLRFREHYRQEQWRIDRVLLTGGFSRFAPVRQALQEGLQEIGLKGSEIDFIDTESTQAVALGAYYIVNDLVQVVEPNHFMLGVVTFGIIDAITQEQLIPIVQPGQVKAGMTTPRFAVNEKMQRLRVKVTEGHTEPIPVKVRMERASTPILLNLACLKKWPQAGEYFIGFQLDRNNRAELILEECQQHNQRRYELKGLH